MLDTQQNQGAGSRGNEEEKTNPTLELLRVFNLRCKLILKTRPGEGLEDSELCQLESDQVTFWRKRVEVSLDIQRLRSPEAKLP